LRAGKAIGEPSGRDANGGTAMVKLRVLATTAAVLTFVATTAALAQDYGGRLLRFGNTSGWYFDGRADNRDFPTNGVFPGDFAVNPANAAIGAAGIFGSNPWHSAVPYPSQVVIGAAPDQAYCARRYRSYDPASGTLLGGNGLRHPC
jgi:BA14K-like protein